MVVLAALLILTCAVVVGHGIRLATPLAAIAVAGSIAATKLRSWRALISVIVLVILFIPVNRYTLPASLPIRLEPYRLAVAIVALFWLTSALIDPRVRLRGTGVIDAPLVLYLLAVAGSEIVNNGRVSTVAPDVVKALLFLVSFIVILFLVPSLLRSLDDIDFVVRVLVGGGAVVAFFALIESRTSFNVFDHLSQAIPALHFEGGGAEVIERGSRLRVFASSQHPIALGAALAMLVPLGVYTAIRSRRLRWWIATLVLLLGTLATVSRTAIVMLGVICLVFLWLRSREVKRLWPLIIPALVLIHLALPGAIGTFAQSFARRVDSSRNSRTRPSAAGASRPSRLHGTPSSLPIRSSERVSGHGSRRWTSRYRSPTDRSLTISGWGRCSRRASWGRLPCSGSSCASYAA